MAGMNGYGGNGGEDYARAWNGLPNTIGKRPGQLHEINHSYYEYANGGLDLTGMVDPQEILRRRMMMQQPSGASNMPAGWYDDPAHGAYNVMGGNPLVEYANGGGFTTEGPTAMVDMSTGQTKAVAGEVPGEREAIATIPLDRPAADPRIAAFQQLLLSAGRPNMIPGAPSDVMRQAATQVRTPVRVSVAA